MNGLLTILAGALLLLLAAPLVVLAQSQLAKKRWGTVEGPLAERHDGAYRGQVVREERERGAPAGLTAGSFLAAMWAAITLAVFVPLGALTTAALLSEGARNGLPTYAAAAAAALFTVSSAALGGAVLLQGVRLARRHTGSIEQTIRVVRFSHAHHGLVWLAGSAAAAVLMPHDALLASLMLGVPCLLGVFAGLALRYAADEALAHWRSELFRAPDAESAQVPASLDAPSGGAIEASSIDASPASGSSTNGRTKLVKS